MSDNSDKLTHPDSTTEVSTTYSRQGSWLQDIFTHSTNKPHRSTHNGYTTDDGRECGSSVETEGTFQQLSRSLSRCFSSSISSAVANDVYPSVSCDLTSRGSLLLFSGRTTDDQQQQQQQHQQQQQSRQQSESDVENGELMLIWSQE